MEMKYQVDDELKVVEDHAGQKQVITSFFAIGYETAILFRNNEQVKAWAKARSKVMQPPPRKARAAARLLAARLRKTNPPATNDAVQESSQRFTARIKEMPQAEQLNEIDCTVDIDKLEAVLMDEGLQKFADPQKALLALIAEKRQMLIAG